MHSWCTELNFTVSCGRTYAMRKIYCVFDTVLIIETLHSVSAPTYRYVIGTLTPLSVIGSLKIDQYRETPSLNHSSYKAALMLSSYT